MTHLTPDELIDALEGLLSEERQAHLATCEQCQRELAGLSSALTDAQQASVPEPSPLFWPGFSQRVRVAIDREPAAGSHWPAWWRWQVLLPLGAMAMIVFALALNIARTEDRSDDLVDNSAAAIELPADSWTMLAELVGEIDIETASAAGVIEPGSAERAVLQLTAEERQELTRLLRAELTRAKS